MAGRPARPLPRACEDARLLASLELDGEIDELGAKQLRRHLASCPDCASWVAEMRSVTSLLRATPFEPVPTDMAPRVPPRVGPPKAGAPCSWSANGGCRERTERVLPRVAT